MISVATQVVVKRKSVQLLAPVVLAAAMLLPWASVQALPFTTDITITGTADFRDGQAAATDVSQTGSYSVKQAGVTTTNTVNGTTVTGVDPLAALLTQTGDGVGITANVNSAIVGAQGEFPMDAGLSIFNSSVSNVYKIWLQFDYNHSVLASGADAFVYSEYSLINRSDNNAMLLYRGVKSDTGTGYQDVLNGVNLGTQGALVANNGSIFLERIINSGELLNLTIQYDMSSGIFSDPGSIDGRFTSFLSIVSVELFENAIPSPATLFLMLAGGIGLMASRRRRG